MVRIWNDRRTFLAVLAILTLFFLGFWRNSDVRVEIVAIALGIASANVVQAIGAARNSRENECSCQKQSQDKGNA